MRAQHLPACVRAACGRACADRQASCVRACVRACECIRTDLQPQAPAPSAAIQEPAAAEGGRLQH